jgi:hypothetical protein
MTLARDELHDLVDSLPDGELHTAQMFLQFLGHDRASNLIKALKNAPWDDEKETPGEREAVEIARKQWKAGDVISDEELWKRLGD